MDYPFSENIEYLTKKEKENLAKFLLHEPIGFKVIYINEKGEKRRPIHCRYPIGAVTFYTKWFTHPQTGVKWYHTPKADKTTKVAAILYEDCQSGKQTNTDSNEWVKWLGDSFTTEVWDHRDKGLNHFIAVQKAIVESGGVNKTDEKPKFDAWGTDKGKSSKPKVVKEKGKKPQWSSPIKKKKS